MLIEAHELGIELPDGWEAEIIRRPDEVAAAAEGDTIVAAEYPVAHLANFPLPPERGDFGSGAVEIMGKGDVLICLVEYDAASADTALFAETGVPTIDPDAFSPNAMQRPIVGQSGTQAFFQQAGRTFCLYVVLGSHGERVVLTVIVNDLLRTLDIRAAR